MRLNGDVRLDLRAIFGVDDNIRFRESLRRVTSGQAEHRSSVRAAHVASLRQPGRGAPTARRPRLLGRPGEHRRCVVPHGFVYDAETGAPIADYQLTTQANTFINDNVLTSDSVYFTDSRQPQIYRLPLGKHGELPAAPDVQTIPLSGDYVHDSDPPTTTNLNGIVATANGKWLIAVQSNTASLLRIDPDTGVADTIELTGGDAMNGDGLLLEGQTLYVVQNFLNRVRVIHLSADFGSGTTVGLLTHPAFFVPTTIDKLNGRLYLPNAKFGITDPDEAPYEVVGLGS